jgi:ferredoxin
VIRIDTARCTGCGACLEACPTGALYLVDGKANVDDSICRDCEACVTACPVEAITLPDQGAQNEVAAGVPALRPGPEVIQIDAQPVPANSRSRALPALGTVLAWAGREMLPWLAGLVRDALDRQARDVQSQSEAQSPEALSADSNRGSHQRRRRRRGGGG